VLVDVEVFVNAQYGYDVRGEVVGETGTLSLAAPHPVRRRAAGLEGFRHAPDWRERFAAAYRAQLQAWIGSVRSGVPAGASAWDGYAATAVADACLASLRTGQPAEVRLEPRPDLYG
jgi:myo-inositol 2-dehydrogenase/D-chiro-inositol 1-dehydrogenase